MLSAVVIIDFPKEKFCIFAIYILFDRNKKNCISLTLLVTPKFILEYLTTRTPYIFHIFIAQLKLINNFKRKSDTSKKYPSSDSFDAMHISLFAYMYVCEFHLN